MRVQGTKVHLKLTFPSRETGLPIDPPDVQVTVQPPDLPPHSSLASAGTVDRDDEGVYHYVIDTDPAAGRWEYEVASLGGDDDVRKQRSFDVRPKIGP